MRLDLAYDLWHSKSQPQMMPSSSLLHHLSVLTRPARKEKKTDCPSLTILGRITNHRIMELPLHARLGFCRFGSIWRNAKHTNRRSMPSGRLALFPVHHLSVLTRPALMDPAYNFVKGQGSSLASCQKGLWRTSSLQQTSFAFILSRKP